MTDNGHEEWMELDQAFIQLRRRMDAEWTRMNAFGLNPMQARILVRLTEEGALKASVLAEKLFITPGAVTGIADKLIEMGLLERERAQDDRRVVFLSVTEEGRSIVKTLKEKRMVITTKMFSGLSAVDIRELTRLLNRISLNIDEANAGRREEAE
ncbi:MarR family winged helix-turn-helix transcriptional regulator [Paenibacillus aurantiacus]|uniref:MarR family winged helix-turn-helix transcriptional regulator n=1 Tax=Paenibacillus aurantiacus TaxID=1936118 RepID=A0ABV5L0D8_9BACL